MRRSFKNKNYEDGADERENEDKMGINLRLQRTEHLEENRYLRRRIKLTMTTRRDAEGDDKALWSNTKQFIAVSNAQLCLPTNQIKMARQIDYGGGHDDDISLLNRRGF